MRDAGPTSPAWLDAGLDYVCRWIEFQMRHLDQPGCAIAVANSDGLVFERAVGVANLATGEPLTPRHRFRVASHSKTFTATGVMRLKAQGRLRLDDPAGAYVDDLHPAVAAATIGQLLSHSAGLTRDGADAGQFLDQRAFLSERELRDALRLAPVLESGVRLKYSNHGYGLLGLIVESVTGEPFGAWIEREVIAQAGLRETSPDMPADRHLHFARGHTARWPLGSRCVIPGDNPANAMAPATGFVSTAADLACFYAQLSPNATRSVLSSESRRDMARPHWRDRDSQLESGYGQGLQWGRTGPWEHVGHLGRFAGTVSRTVSLLAPGLTVSVLTNAIDGPAAAWLDTVCHVLQQFSAQGAPSAELAAWNGRWWTLWGAVDLVATGAAVHVCHPVQNAPFRDASQITPTGPDAGVITRAVASDRFGERVRRVREGRDDSGGDGGGDSIQLWLGGLCCETEAAVVSKIRARYGAPGLVEDVNGAVSRPSRPTPSPPSPTS